MNVLYSTSIPKTVAPGQTVDLSIRMRAPIEPGVYRSDFQLQNAAGVQFGLSRNKEDTFWVEIIVQESVTTFDFVEQSCAAQWLSGAGTLPCPGQDGDSRGFILRVNNPRFENGEIGNSPGLLTSPQAVQDGYIMGIYPTYRVQKGDRFQSIVNCEEGAENCFVVFRLDYQIDSGAIQTHWAFLEQYEGISYQADVDLSSLAGQDVKFILSVLAVGTADDDRAIWGAPRIIHKFEIPIDPLYLFYPYYPYYPFYP
jgi:hypothetical protein